MITVITPTGDRPEAFVLARKWMSSQTVKPDQWLVIDDGKVPLPINLREDLEYIRRTPLKNEGHTLTLNMVKAVPFIKGDKILIVEDDDWYSPDYIATMSGLLDSYDLVGESYARYYHLPAMKFRRIGNNAHASFCQTGFTSKLLPLFESCLPGDPYIDARIWSVPGISKYLIVDTEDRRRLHCSIKGLKGRLGIGTGHNSEARYYGPDVGLEYLVRWVGEENAKIYMNHVGQSFESSRLVGIDKRGHIAIPPPPPLPSEDGITVITCTGDRPESFKLLRIWMEKQVRKPNQWLVVDDGKVPLSPAPGFEYYRRDPTPNDFPHTLCQNMLMALEHVSFDKIIIMEDDDWYHPTYIDYMSKLLDTADLVGFRNLMFYYPSTGKYMVKGSVKQPAFAQTAFDKKLVSVVQDICKSANKEWQLSGKGLIDLFLWAHSLDYDTRSTCIRLTTALKIADGKIVPKGMVFHSPFPPSLVRRANRNMGAEYFTQNVPIKGVKKLVACDTYLSVGMKGMPGRKGLTTQHEISNQRYKIDAGYNLLKSILKTDADFYIKKST